MDSHRRDDFNAPGVDITSWDHSAHSRLASWSPASTSTAVPFEHLYYPPSKASEEKHVLDNAPPRPESPLLRCGDHISLVVEGTVAKILRCEDGFTYKVVASDGRNVYDIDQSCGKLAIPQVALESITEPVPSANGKGKGKEKETMSFQPNASLRSTWSNQTPQSIAYKILERAVKTETASPVVAHPVNRSASSTPMSPLAHELYPHTM